MYLSRSARLCSWCSPSVWSSSWVISRLFMHVPSVRVLFRKTGFRPPPGIRPTPEKQLETKISKWFKFFAYCTRTLIQLIDIQFKAKFLLFYVLLANYIPVQHLKVLKYSFAPLRVLNVNEIVAIVSICLSELYASVRRNCLHYFRD